MSLILTTGGLGFIGSHTCLNLIDKGLDVLIVDSLINSSIRNLENIKSVIKLSNNSNSGKIYFSEGDLRDHKWLDSLFAKQISLKKPITSVIHFAGLKSVKESVLEPLKYWDFNINTTLSLISSMQKYQCNTLVFSSSATIYRPIESDKLFENSYKDPINPYGNTKLTIEKILKDLYISDSKKWKIINLRYFNPVGAHNSGKIGEDSQGPVSNLFPILEKVVSGKLDKLSIYGKDWPTKDGTCVRDYIHIMDLAEAHFAALNFLKSNSPQNVSVNIGTGKGVSVLEIVEAYSKYNKIRIPIQFVSRRLGDTPFLVADNNYALNLLDWRPVKTLEDICVDSFRYIKNKLLLNKGF